MKQEYSYGAILYNRFNNKLKYIIVKDRNNNYSFPKGHIEKGETEQEAAIREVFEETNINLVIDNNYFFDMEYIMPNGNIKHVKLFLGDYSLQQPKINDPEILEILELDYEDGYKLITFDNYKEAFKHANDYLNKI